jgi:hypothetical protein
MFSLNFTFGITKIPALTVRLCDVSMYSSLARRSCISLSMAGSVIYLPLLCGISLSSGGSGVSLSLLLGGMVKSIFFSATESKEPFCALIPEMMMLAPSTTCRSEGPRQHRIFPFPLARRALEWLFYFPFGKPAPTVNFRNSPFCFRKLDFALLRIRWSRACLSDPRNPKSVNADPSSSLPSFSLSRFRWSRCQATYSRDS